MHFSLLGGCQVIIGGAPTSQHSTSSDFGPSPSTKRPHWGSKATRLRCSRVWGQRVRHARLGQAMGRGAKVVCKCSSSAICSNLLLSAAYSRACPCCCTADIVLAAVQQHGRALEYAAPLGAERDIVLVAGQHVHSLLQMGLRADHCIFLAAVQQDDTATFKENMSRPRSK